MRCFSPGPKLQPSQSRRCAVGSSASRKALAQRQEASRATLKEPGEGGAGLSTGARLMMAQMGHGTISQASPAPSPSPFPVVQCCSHEKPCNLGRVRQTASCNLHPLSLSLLHPEVVLTGERGKVGRGARAGRALRLWSSAHHSLSPHLALLLRCSTACLPACLKMRLAIVEGHMTTARQQRLPAFSFYL